MNAFENINNLTMEGAAKERICENLATRLEKQEKGLSRTWGVAFTSKRVRAVAAIALSAALVTAVAVPVGIYYGGQATDHSVSGGGRLPSIGGGNPAAPISPFWCEYRFDTDVWDVSDVEVNFYCEVDKEFYDYYSKARIISIDVYTCIANYEILNESVESKGWNLFGNLEDVHYVISEMPKGLVVDGVYLCEKFSYNNSKDFFMDFGYIKWSYTNDSDLSYFPEELRDVYENPDESMWPNGHSETLHIPQELISGDSGSIIFDMICFVTYENDVVIVKDAGKFSIYNIGIGWPQVNYSVEDDRVKFYN